MARLPQAANTEGNNEGLEDFTPLPGGKYTAVIEKSEWKQTKAKTGNYLQLIWKVIDGEYTGRTIFDNLNLDNPNPVAVQIANKSLNSICKACDLVGVEDSEELHGIPVLLDIKLVPATEQNPASNNIRGYEPAGEVNSVSESEDDEDQEQGEPDVPKVTPKAAPKTTPKTGPPKQKLPWE